MGSMSHRGLSLDPIHPNISQLLQKYESIWGQSRNPALLAEIHGRTPWISVSSNAIVGGIDGSNYQLQGDWQAAKKEGMYMNKRVGISPVGNTKSKWMYNYVKRRYMPKAGVIEFEVDSKGGLGSIRYGKLKVKAYTKEDLEVIERYYMVPGLRILVEWGWSTWSGAPINIWKDKYHYGNGSLDIQEQIIQNVVGVNSLHASVSKNGSDSGKPGRYDAMIGLVTKFSWAMDDGGAYDCDIEITSTNGMMLSMPMDSANLGGQLITMMAEYVDNTWPWPNEWKPELKEDSRNISDI